MKFDNDCDVIFYVQNVIEHRYSWNKCFIIYQTNAAMQKCCSMSQYFTGNETKNASCVVSKCFTVMVQCKLWRDMKIMAFCQATKLLTYLVF